MVNVEEVVEEVKNLLKGREVNVEREGEEVILTIVLNEYVSVYVSILCSGNECGVSYAIGDENFVIDSSQVGMLDEAVKIIKEINELLAKRGIVK